MKLFPAFLLSLLVFSQYGCLTTTKVTDWKDAVEQKKYAAAIPLLEKEIEKEKEPLTKAKMAYNLAECYRFTNQPKRAEAWYKKAIDGGAKPEAIYWYAQTLKASQKYDAAIKQFRIYLKEEPYLRAEITNEIRACENAKTWMSVHSNYKVTNMEMANSSAADFMPAFYQGNKLVFTSSRAGATGENSDQ